MLHPGDFLQKNTDGSTMPALSRLHSSSSMRSVTSVASTRLPTQQVRAATGSSLMQPWQSTNGQTNASSSTADVSPQSVARRPPLVLSSSLMSHSSENVSPSPRSSYGYPQIFPQEPGSLTRQSSVSSIQSISSVASTRSAQLQQGSLRNLFAGQLPHATVVPSTVLPDGTARVSSASPPGSFGRPPMPVARSLGQDMGSAMHRAQSDALAARERQVRALAAEKAKLQVCTDAQRFPPSTTQGVLNCLWRLEGV